MSERVSIREKIAYGLGDTASNFVFQSVMLMMAFFYTNIFGIPPKVVAVLFLAVRIFDAVTDPLMGWLTDRTHTKWGKYRPWLLWLALPFGLITVLAFTTPDLSENGKIVYAYITYTLLMAAYTAINIPYSALGGALTPNVDERVSVQGYRFFCAQIAAIIVTSLTYPLVEYFGNGDDALGYQRTVAAMSAVGVVLFIMCFAGTKERVEPPKDQDDISVWQGLKSLFKNDQWRVLAIVAILVLTGMVIKGTLALYYLEEYLDVSNYVNPETGSNATFKSIFITAGTVGNLIGVTLASTAAAKFCKVKIYSFVSALAAILSLIAYFVPPDMVVLAIALYFFFSVTIQLGTPILWSFMADLVDYGHYTSGTRINGMTYSTLIFFIKMGVAIGGSVAMGMLAFYGYDASVPVTGDVKEGINLAFNLLPIIPLVLVVIIMRFYNLTEARVKEIQSELPMDEMVSDKL